MMRFATIHTASVLAAISMLAATVPASPAPARSRASTAPALVDRER
jgi:hypothetical protein